MASKTRFKPIDSITPKTWDGTWMGLLEQVTKHMGCGITEVSISYGDYIISTPDGVKIERKVHARH